MYSAQKGVLSLLDFSNRKWKRSIEKIELRVSRGTEPNRLCVDRHAVGQHIIGGRPSTGNFGDNWGYWGHRICRRMGIECAHISVALDGACWQKSSNKGTRLTLTHYEADLNVAARLELFANG